jgi:beta-glucosidase
MTEYERFALVVSVVGENPVIPLARHERIPAGTPMSSGYTPGVPRLGIPALLMSDASLGVINPGFREEDTATALPASIALGSSFNPEFRSCQWPHDCSRGLEQRVQRPASGRH